MALVAGMLLGRYEVLAPLGAGGMGEVYRARDTRLDRIVALKMLAPRDTPGAAGVERFEREARSIAALNHPHICALHDIVRHEDRELLVLEHLEGETLEQRLRAGPLPLRETLRHGADLADALDAAHRAGIVHRDVKPSNVMLTSAGAKLLDFGVAKLLEESGGGLPDATASLTAEGQLLGTLRYMSPEQLEHKPVDARSDIFALGALLYEMASGQPAFPGESTASQIAAVLTSEPAPLSEPGGRHALEALDHVVRRCLARQPDARWRSAGDVRAELEWIGESRERSDPAGRARARLRPALAVVGALAVAGTGVLVGIRAWTATAAASDPARPIVFSVTPPATARFVPSGGSLALSPDGAHLAFVAADRDSGELRLWIRDFDTTQSRPLPGTDGARLPFWSPDSSYLAFFAGRSMKKIRVSGGPPETICDVRHGWPGAWNRDGTIVFVPDDSDGLWQVPDRGGAPVRVTSLDRGRGEIWHGWPSFLPDGRHFLYAAGAADTGREAIFVSTLGSTERVQVLAATSNAQYVPPGYLLYRTGAGLVAQRFSVDDLRATGPVTPLAEDVVYNLTSNRAMFSASDTGVLAYRTRAPRRIAWYDRRGHLLRVVDRLGSAFEPALSGDGRRLAVSRPQPGTGDWDVWTCEVATDACAPATSNPAAETAPLWLHDGTLLLSSDRGGLHAVYSKRVGSSDPEELVYQSSHKNATVLLDVLPDDRRAITAGGSDPHRLADTAVVGLGKASAAVPLFRPGENVDAVRLSPDGRWMAYSSLSGSRSEVFVRAFPDGQEQDPVRVSPAGGTEPRWRRDGRELYYLATDGRLMAVPVRTLPVLEAGRPVALFALQVDVASQGSFAPNGRNSYDVTPDGQRFVVSETAEDPPITVVVNWPALVRR